MTPPRPPEALRRAVAASLAPVRPLQPPWRRALPVAAATALLAGAVPALVGLRMDAPGLGVGLTWGAALLECGLGVWLAALALHEAVPGMLASRRLVASVLAAGVAAQLAVALLTRAHTPGVPAEEVARHPGPACFTAQALLSIPVLALLAWLVIRGLPLRPRWAGALVGTAAAMVADGAWHLACPVADLAHVLGWHGSASVLAAATGWGLAALWARRREHRASHPAQGPTKGAG